jgi:hypothetical protein
MTSKRLLVHVGAAALMISTQVFASDAPGRTLQKTNLRAVTPICIIGPCPPGPGAHVVIGTSFVSLLTPTTITCPGSTTCTIHVEVSSEINSLNAGAELRFRLLVDGSVAEPGIAWVRVATNNSAAATDFNGATFQWFKTGLTPGNHMVEWLAAVTSPTAVAFNRIQKINIYTP